MGFQIQANPYKRRLMEPEACELLRDAVGVIAGTEPLTTTVFDACPRLKVISRVGVGLDSVDLDAAARRGIKVFNTPDAHVPAVAELTLGMILASLRGIAVSDRGMRSGQWQRPMGGLLQGRRVGLIGLGRVAKALVEMLSPFKVEVMACDPHWDTAFADRHSIMRCELPDLLKQAQVISLHVPGAQGTLIGSDALALMRDDVLLVNSARGGLIDESALHAFLSAHPAAGCALDVFDDEPYSGPLIELPNALLTAHIGGYAREARQEMERQAVENLLIGLGLSPAGKHSA